MRIQIVNLAQEIHGRKFAAEYIGRKANWCARPASPLASPFRIGQDGSRARCIELYRGYLAERIKCGDPSIMAELRRLATILNREKTLTLSCWCAPLPCCSGEVIVEELKKIFSSEDV